MYLLDRQGLKLDFKKQKTHEYMENEQCSPQSSMNQRRNKERNLKVPKIHWK